MSGRRILLAIDDLDWHARALIAAFAALGVQAIPRRLHDVRFATASASGLVIDGFGETVPEAVLVRSISAGSFEAITRRLGVLHALRRLGCVVWNDAAAIERCVDKAMTSFLLARAGLPTPRTVAVEGRTQAVEAVRASDRPLVLKPLFGSQGRGLRLVRHEGDLPDEAEVGAVYYLQDFEGVEARGYVDFRLFVSAGKVVAAMARRAEGWVTNIRQGGTPRALVPGVEASDLAVRAAACVGADYAGVDLMRDRDGRLVVIEVNSMPGWKGLQEVSEASVAEAIVDGFLRSLP